METINGLVNGAVVIGFVNLVSVFFPKYAESSKAKATVALAAALALVYVPIPAQVGEIVNLLFGSSGAYKVASKIGALRS